MFSSKIFLKNTQLKLWLYSFINISFRNCVTGNNMKKLFFHVIEVQEFAIRFFEIFSTSMMKRDHLVIFTINAVLTLFVNNALYSLRYGNVYFLLIKIYSNTLCLCFLTTLSRVHLRTSPARRWDGSKQFPAKRSPRSISSRFLAGTRRTGHTPDKFTVRYGAGN